MRNSIKQWNRAWILVAALILVTSVQCVAQRELDDADPIRQKGKVCGYSLITGFSWDSNTEARDALKKVIEAANYLPDRFVIEAADVENAYACEDKNSSFRFILYNPSWIRGLTPTGNSGNYWAKVAILAHEVAHHALSHTLRGRRSTPALELEADLFAGTLLAKMNAPLDLVTAAFDQPAMCSKAGTDSHPKCADRVSAVTRGWRAVLTWVRGVPHQSIKGLIATSKEGYWGSDAGYSFLNASDPTDLRVKWNPNARIASRPHVYAAETEGKWTPDPGYVWVNPNKPGDFSVRWKPGVKIGNHQHVVACEVEGKYCPEAGYDWDDPLNRTNLAVHPVARSVAAARSVSAAAELLSEARPLGNTDAKGIVKIDRCTLNFKWGFQEERISLGTIQRIEITANPSHKYSNRLAILTTGNAVKTTQNDGKIEFDDLVLIYFASKDLAESARAELLTMDTNCKTIAPSVSVAAELLSEARPLGNTDAKGIVKIDGCTLNFKWGFQEERISLGAIQRIEITANPSHKYSNRLAILTTGNAVKTTQNDGKIEFDDLVLIYFASKDLAESARAELLTMDARCKVTN